MPLVAAAVLGFSGTAVAAPHHGAGRPASPLSRTTNPASAALTTARRTGRSVPVDALTTPTSTTVADPRGTFTLTQSATPVRARQHGTWKSLDPRLHLNADHTVSPNVTTGGLTLSGGGTGPLATMTATGHTLSLTWPTPLPAPVVSGATATYRSVLKDVDLVVTVSPQGGFSDTLVVRSAAAAADPRLAKLTMAVRSDQLTVSADAAGNLRAAATAKGDPVFTAAAPAMWDSATTRGRASGVTAPGSGAHVAPVKVTAGRSITLTPDRGLLTGRSTVFPVYIDPTWIPQYVASAREAWAQVDTLKRNVAHWMPSALQSGFCAQGTCTPAYTARSYVRMSVPAQLQGARIESSELDLTASGPYSSCSGAPTPGIQLWSTGGISPSTTWNDGPSWHQKLAEPAPAACALQDVRFPITAFVQAHTQGADSLTFGIRAASETDGAGWKQFAASSMIMSTTYDHAPGLPSDPATSPGGPCRTGDPSATLIGNDDVTFQTVASDPDGDPLGTEFVVKDDGGNVVYDTGDPATSGVASASGTVVRLVIRGSQIKGWHADGATTPHTYSWYTRSSDGELYSPTTGLGSAGSPCTFTYDPTEPPAPGIAVTTDASGHAGALGQTTTLTLAPCAGALANPPVACTGTAPATYSYQLNTAAPQKVTATGGVQTVQIPLHHVGPNSVTVFALSAAGNPGPSASATFVVDLPATPYADGDVDGDGHADLLYPGPAANPGLWLARGDGAGHLNGPVDIGAAGTGTSTNGTPADWNGAEVLHGDFTGDRVQDVLAYYPSGDRAGGGSLVFGNGDDLPLDPVSGNQQNLFQGQLADYTLNADGDNPTQLVAAGNASLSDTGIADLIGISGDATNGYQLDLYTGIAAFAYGYTQTLAGPAESPDGQGDWNDFTLVTAQPAGKTVLFAVKKSTGELWESANPSQDPATLVGTPGTWTRIQTPWSTAPTLVSGDVDAAGDVELWAQDGTDFTPYTLTGTALQQGATVSLPFPPPQAAAKR